MIQLHVTNEELSRKRREAQPYIDYFSQHLYRIYSIMPHQGYIINNGVLETLPPLPEWQMLIDRVIEMRDETLKSKFPELYGA